MDPKVSGCYYTPGSYAHLVDVIEASSLMAVSIEGAPEHVDLHVLEKLTTTTVILGTVATGTSRVHPGDSRRAT